MCLYSMLHSPPGRILIICGLCLHAKTLQCSRVSSIFYSSFLEEPQKWRVQIWDFAFPTLYLETFGGHFKFRMNPGKRSFKNTLVFPSLLKEYTINFILYRRFSPALLHYVWFVVGLLQIIGYCGNMENIDGAVWGPITALGHFFGLLSGFVWFKKKTVLEWIQRVYY